jgi:ABC-type phosphate transport system auxiliary subunit
LAIYNPVNLNEVETLCGEIINSPYMRKELPPELQKLRVLLKKVEQLTRDDVPAMISEIKRLRSQNKRLEAEADALAHPPVEAELAESGPEA